MQFKVPVILALSATALGAGISAQTFNKVNCTGKVLQAVEATGQKTVFVPITNAASIQIAPGRDCTRGQVEYFHDRCSTKPNQPYAALIEDLPAGESKCLKITGGNHQCASIKCIAGLP